MTSTLLQVLPVAVAIAVEPVCILAALAMLATERPIANSAAYLAALVGVTFGYGAAVLLVFRHQAAIGGGRTDDIVQLLWLLIGLGFLAAFLVVLLRRGRPQAAGEARWLRQVQRAGPWGAAGVGLFLVNWEMETPALTEIVKSHPSLLRAFAILVAFTVVAVSTSVAPLATYLAAPTRVEGLLDDGASRLRRRQRLLVLVVLAVVGAAYTWKGTAALLAS